MKDWITNHRVFWCMILFSIGIGIGMGSMVLLGAPMKNGIQMSLAYSSVLVIAELIMGGVGAE